MRGKIAGNEEGLTFFELMVVLFILSLFAALVLPNITPQMKKAEIKTTRHQLQILAVALENYRLDVGEYPDSLEALIQSSTTKWNGPYLRPERIPRDPWGNDYVYVPLEGEETFDLYSTGKGEEEIRFGDEI